MPIGGEILHMSTIKKIPRKDMDAWVNIVTNAYPGMKIISDEEKRRVRDRLWLIERIDPGINQYGLYKRNKLVGGMRLFDFTMTMFTTELPLGGLGLVAVDLAHKKEHVCKELVDYFINYYKKKKAPILALYSFRPDFYKKMGFGYGTKTNQYRIKPASLPRGDSKKNIIFATRTDHKALNNCYHRVTARTHGMIKRTKTYMRYLTKPGNKIVAVKKKGRIEGFIVFSFKPSSDENWLAIELDIVECIYENREAFLELMTFLHSQSDQVHCIRFTTHDEFFHFLPSDPRTDSGRLIPEVAHESNTQGVGIMYRVIDTKNLFRRLKNHDFGNQNCKLKISIHDSLYPKHDGSYIIHFAGGRPLVKTGNDYEVEISLDVSDFSSLVMGVVPFDKLYELGRAEISDTSYLDTVTRIFATDKKPMCVTQF
jgi:predicted acetyltransferase